MNMIFIDASGQILGRMCSVVAKRLLNGEEITVVNAEKALITGNRHDVLDEFKWRRRVGSQRKGPYYPRRPDSIMKRTIKGMLPHKQARGREALNRLRVYVAVPTEFASKKLETVEEASSEGLESFLTLEEISKLLGAEF